MQENHLFEYAVLRVVPLVEREEFLNVGLVLYCREKQFLRMKFTLNEQRLLAFCSTLDIADLEDHLAGLQKICAGGKEAGQIGELDMASRFRWLTAARSTVIQTSKVHPGFCKDPLDTLNRLYKELVL